MEVIIKAVIMVMITSIVNSKELKGSKDEITPAIILEKKTVNQSVIINEEFSTPTQGFSND